MNRFGREMDKVAHLNRIALALARDVTPEEMAHTVTDECKAVLKADAICLYLLQPDNEYHLISQRGCTPDFVSEWSRFPRGRIIPIDAEPGSHFFFGTSDEFKLKFPSTSNLVDGSGRAMIGYAALEVDNSPVGLLGFSYNKIWNGPPDHAFISLLVNLCSQALDRARLSRMEKAANRAKTEFLANVNHELRTPLSLIQGYTELLVRDETLSERNRHWARIVNRSTRQLATLVGEVLDLSKIESARLEVVPSAACMAELIDEVRLAAEQKAGERGLRFEIFTHGLPEYLWIDALRFRQILLNLIGNSIKFTDSGFIRLRLLMKSDDVLEATVTDTGAGIPQEDHQNVFEPFMQVAGEAGRRIGGTGLGLPISRAWARALGGDLVLLRSQPRIGSEFLLSVRCRACTAIETAEVLQRESLTQAAPSDKGNLAGKAVLVVDDSADNRDMIQFFLQRLGAVTDCAANGVEGITKALIRNYDIILMDLQMPGMDGLTAVKRLRSQGYSGAIAALTASAMRDQKDQALTGGFDLFLTKPIDMASLAHAIHDILNLRLQS